MKRIAVIGASLAGLSAARALRAQGFDGELTVVGGESRRPYDRPPLSKEFLAGDVTAEDLALESDTDDLRAQWLLRAHTSALDPVAPCDSMTGPPWPPTALWWPPGHGHGPGQAPRISPACTCCAPSRTPSRCAPNYGRVPASW